MNQPTTSKNTPAAAKLPPSVSKVVDIKSIIMVPGFNARSDKRMRANGSVDAVGTYGDDDGGGSLGVDGLADRLEAEGQLSPIGLRSNKKDPAKYDLVFGNRRFLAASLLAENKRTIKGLERGQIKADVFVMTDLDARTANIAENTERDDLATPDLAYALGDLEGLMKAEGEGVDDKTGQVSSVAVAKRIGKSQTYTIRLLKIVRNLHPSVFNAWRDEPTTVNFLKVHDTVAKITQEKEGPNWAEKQMIAFRELLTATKGKAGKADGRTDEAWITKAKERAGEVGAQMAKMESCGFVDIAAIDIDSVKENIRTVVKFPETMRDESVIHGNTIRGIAQALIDGYKQMVSTIAADAAKEEAEAKEEAAKDKAGKTAKN
jgi:ParB-like chromosome segregation protein Spo0J